MIDDKLLTEKYRPTILDDLYINKQYKKIIKNFIKYNIIQNIIFYGPSGTGKTSTALLLCRSIIEKKY